MNNYPRFEILVKEEEKEEEIMERLEKKIKEMEEILGEPFEQSQKCWTPGSYSLADKDEGGTKNHFVPTPQLCGVNDEPVNMLWATDPNREKDRSPDEQEAVGVVFPSLTVNHMRK